MSSFDVRVWEIGKKTVRGKTWYRLRWAVDGRPFEQLYKTKALANSKRAELIQATNAGRPFDAESGRPVAELRAAGSPSFYSLARSYMVMKWPRAAARSRRGAVESLAAVAVIWVRPNRGRPDPATLRAALHLYGLNPPRYGVEAPEQFAGALAWMEKASRPVVELEGAAQIRRVLDALAVKLDGGAAAAATVRRKRAVLYNALGYAVEQGHLEANPIDRVQWTVPETAQAIDRRVVANPEQVAALLASLLKLGPRAARLAAFFGVIYYAGTRPAEAASLRQQDCELPELGWGKIVLAETDAGAGRNWTDSGATHERRGLKHRGRKETRTVGIPPVLVGLLRDHEHAYGLAADGRFFRGLHGGALSDSVYDRWWKIARKAALTPAQVESPLARRAYDLRHAAASLWLNAGVPPTEVARRLGHSVAVLLRVYVNCIDGDEGTHNGRISDALGL